MSWLTRGLMLFLRLWAIFFVFVFAWLRYLALRIGAGFIGKDKRELLRGPWDRRNDAP